MGADLPALTAQGRPAKYSAPPAVLEHEADRLRPGRGGPSYLVEREGGPPGAVFLLDRAVPPPVTRMAPPSRALRSPRGPGPCPRGAGAPGEGEVRCGGVGRPGPGGPRCARPEPGGAHHPGAGSRRRRPRRGERFELRGEPRGTLADPRARAPRPAVAGRGHHRPRGHVLMRRTAAVMVRAALASACT